MKYSNFCKLLGKLESNSLTFDEAQSLSTIIHGMIDCLNEADLYGDIPEGEGWRHYMGMDE